MNKKIPSLLMAFCLVCSLAACSGSSNTQNASNASTSGCAPDDGFGCVVEDAKSLYQKEVADYQEISFDDAIALFEEGGSGLLYFGFPDCPWCEELVPLLSEEADRQGVDVLYVRTRDDDLERLYSDEQKETIEPYIKAYMRVDDELKLALYVPLIVAVENGEAVDGHQGTVSGHDAHERKMTDEEKAELKAKVERVVSALGGDQPHSAQTSEESSLS